MIYFVYQSLLYVFLLMYIWYRIRKNQVSFRIAWNMALILMVSGFVGARLFHIFYENPEVYARDWTQAFRFWQGGFVYFGGLIAGLVACAIYLKYEKEDFLKWADFYAPVLALGYALGRIGCLITGCCYGAFCDAPWAIHDRHPTQLYATFTESLVFLYLNKREKADPPTGTLFALWMMGHGIGRIFMESYRGDDRGSFVMGLSISTWLSLILFASGAGLLSWTQSRKKAR